ncbi:Apoptosis-inducing factor 2 [Podila minutissima]|uniref:Apoptosis-inducing factor 2 n=1 Tax=Podila minutissima TaxID=64525 RepID=A0A9P5VRE1_9FUNG|nr:Apoptosis-inducing factor 2 [Podila minutissima]
MAPTKIIVVGGSYAGIAVINQLLASKANQKQEIEITLIERQQNWIPYTKLFPKGSKHKIVQGKIAEVHHHHVILATGVSIPFDYMALCTGSLNPSPAKFNVDSSAEALAITKKAREDLVKSKSVVVVGGGACGVELAGEIKTAYQDKNVTLIHATSTLVDYPGYSDAMKSGALTHLESLGVNVVLNEKIAIEGLTFENAIQVAPRSIHASGKVIESDIQFLSVGIRVDTGYLSTLKPANHAAFDSSRLVNAGTHTIKVRKTLQIDQEGLTHIFAVGDCGDFSKVPTAAACKFTAPTAAKNILALAENENSKKTSSLSNGNAPPAVMCLTTGPTTGVLSLPLVGMRFSNFFSKLLKSKDLMLGGILADMRTK